jgi:hypothetical protein
LHRPTSHQRHEVPPKCDTGRSPPYPCHAASSRRLCLRQSPPQLPLSPPRLHLQDRGQAVPPAAGLGGRPRVAATSSTDMTPHCEGTTPPPRQSRHRAPYQAYRPHWLHRPTPGPPHEGGGVPAAASARFLPSDAIRQQRGGRWGLGGWQLGFPPVVHRSDETEQLVFHWYWSRELYLLLEKRKK